MGSELRCSNMDPPHAQSAPAQGTQLWPLSRSGGRRRPTLPVVLVVAGAGHGDEGGEEQWEEEGAEPQSPASLARSEAAQLPGYVEGREGETSKGD